MIPTIAVKEFHLDRFFSTIWASFILSISSFIHTQLHVVSYSVINSILKSRKINYPSIRIEFKLTILILLAHSIQYFISVVMLILCFVLVALIT